MLKQLNVFIGMIVFIILLSISQNSLACYYKDYGDATGYPVASHEMYSSTNSYQWFGVKISREGSSRPIDTFDDGLTFSEFKVGETATIDFTAHSIRRSYNCTNVYEYIKIWIDWNQDKDFSDAGENIYNYAWKLPTWTGTKTLTKTISFLVPTDAILGSTWLRARISCKNNMSSYGFYNQGEVEDYEVDVVPEPGTILLLGSLATGLFGMASIRKKKS